MNYTLYDLTKYSHKIGMADTEVKQTYRVDLGDVYPRDTAIKLIQSNTVPLCPKRYDVRPKFPNQYCEFVDFEQHEDAPNIWDIRVFWKTATNLQERIKDPAERPVLIVTGTYKYQKSPLKDNDDKPVVTTAGEPIAYSYQKAAPTYTFIKCLKDYPVKLGKERDFVNKDTVEFLGMKYKPYELYIPEVSISHLLLENEYRFYEMSLTMYVLTEEFGWRTRLRNQGYHELKEVGVKWQYAPVNPRNPQGRYRWQYVKQYALDAIKLGSPGRYSYPTSPILLTPEGRAFRELTEEDKAIDQALIDDARANGRRPPAARLPGYGTGPILGLHNPDGPAQSTGISQAQFDAAVLEFNFMNVVDFNGLVPLT